MFVDEFTSLLGELPAHSVSFDGGVYNGDNIEITYHNRTLAGTPQLSWFYGWLGYEDIDHSFGTGLTVNLTVKNVPSPYTYNNTLVVKCEYLSNGTSGGTPTTYAICFPGVRQGSRITVKNSNASEVQVSYENYEEVSSSGQRIMTALYDVYGNKVSSGCLDGLGMGTLSTKGKPGYYIVKVMVNNQVIFTETIQVK